MDDRNNRREFIIEIIPNRSINTITKFFRDNVEAGTTIKSDGYPSYPRACSNNSLNHIVINHTEGFINEFGDHTNIIENLWSHFKTEMRTKRGIIRHNIPDFVVEFQWRKKFLKCKKIKISRNVFSEY